MTGVAPETRLPCPVCLGVMMKKTTLTGRGQRLVLDSCSRCGGIWFERGEMQRLRAHPPKALWDLVTQRQEPIRAPCHNCHALIDRNAEKCGACGTRNRIQCPSCQRELTVETHEGYRLDICRNCKGVWFDHVELEAIWKLSLHARRPGTTTADAADVGASVLIDSLIWAPDLVFHGAHAAGMAVSHGVSALAHAPEAVGAVAEGAGELASGLFEAIAAIIGGLFDG